MSVKAQQSLCLYVVLTMPTLNKTYLFIYLCIQTYLMASIIIVIILIISLYIAFHNLQKGVVVSDSPVPVANIDTAC